MLEGAPVRLKILHCSSSSSNETHSCADFLRVLNRMPDLVILNTHFDQNQSNFKQKSRNSKAQTPLTGHQDIRSPCWCHRRPCRVHRGPIMCKQQLTSSAGFMKGRHDQSHDEPDGCRHRRMTGKEGRLQVRLRVGYTDFQASSPPGSKFLVCPPVSERRETHTNNILAH